MATGTDVASLALGNVAKAVITIIDGRNTDEIEVDEPVTVKKETTKSIAVESSVPATNSKMGTFETTITVLEDVTEMQTVTKTVKRNTEKHFYVQFNPSSLTVSGYGGGRVSKTNFTKAGGGDSQGLQFGAANVRITMNVRLIFDQVDPQDAFMFDKLNTSYTSLATGAAKAALTVTGKKTVSVQKQVEGFIAALRLSTTRNITFAWGEMIYSGVLNRVSSQYTMFDVLGKPVRAYVDLSLVCQDKSVEVDNMGFWGKAYKEAFKGNTSYVTSSQAISNLLNG